MSATAPEPERQDPRALLQRALASGRLHASFLLAGGGQAPRDAALEFARGVVCTGDPSGGRPCGACRSCHLSGAVPEDGQEIVIDGTGKSGPLYRHIGDHPDLYWVDRGGEGTRVRITQVRALQSALRLAAHEGGWRAAVIACCNSPITWGSIVVLPRTTT